MGPCANTSIVALGSAALYVVGGGLQPQHSPTVWHPHYQPLTYNLHAQHMAEAFMLNACKQFSEKVSCHIIGTNELQINGTVADTLADEMISHIDVLHCSMVYWVPHEQIGHPVIDVQRGGLVNALAEFR